MADQKISQLPSGAPAALTDPFPTARGGASKSLTVQDVLLAVSLFNATAPAASTDQIGAVRSGAPIRLTVADIVALSQRRNLVINGAFDIAQRGVSYAVTNSAVYGCVDRWWMLQGGTPQATFSRVALTAGLALQGFGFGLKCLLTGTSTGTVRFGSIFETIDVTRYQGRSITLVARVMRGSTWNPSNLNVKIITGTGSDEGRASLIAGTWAGQANTLDQNVSPFTAWQTLTIGTVAVPAGCTELGVQFSATPTGAAVDANSFLIVTGVEIVDSAAASVFGFETRPLASELELAQRYYEKSYQLGTAVPTNASIATESAIIASATATSVVCQVIYKVRKRAAGTPSTFSFTSSTPGVISSSTTGTDLAASSAAVQNATERGFQVVNSSAGTITSSSWGFIFHWATDAEL